MGIREVGYKTYWACERVITPGLQYSQCTYRDVLLPLLKRKRRWLDIGCGHQLFAQWMREDQRTAIASCEQAFGCDLDFEGMRLHPDLRNKCMASGYGLPYASRTMDIVTANMVMEHVDNPDTFFTEVERVLVPGGLFLFHTPNRHGYATVLTQMVSNQAIRNILAGLLDGRKEEDVFPTFYRANDEESIHRLAARRGLTVRSIDLVETNAMLGSLGPLAIPELLAIRAMRAPWAKRYRATLIATLVKPEAPSVEADWEDQLKGAISEPR
jgi:SAM-dependent methyltransferase